MPPKEVIEINIFVAEVLPAMLKHKHMACQVSSFCEQAPNLWALSPAAPAERAARACCAWVQVQAREARGCSMQMRSILEASGRLASSSGVRCHSSAWCLRTPRSGAGGLWCQADGMCL